MVLVYLQHKERKRQGFPENGTHANLSFQTRYVRPSLHGLPFSIKTYHITYENGEKTWRYRPFSRQKKADYFRCSAYRPVQLTDSLRRPDDAPLQSQTLASARARPTRRTLIPRTSSTPRNLVMDAQTCSGSVTNVSQYVTRRTIPDLRTTTGLIVYKLYQCRPRLIVAGVAFSLLSRPVIA